MVFLFCSERLCDFLVPKRLPDFLLSQEVALFFFVSRGWVFFVVSRLPDFLFPEVAWFFFVPRGPMLWKSGWHYFWGVICCLFVVWLSQRAITASSSWVYTGFSDSHIYYHVWSQTYNKSHDRASCTFPLMETLTALLRNVQHSWC